MTKAVLESLLKGNQNIECRSDECFTYFRNNHLPWYAHNPSHCTRIDNALLQKMTPGELLLAVNRGVEVEHITRITGYFTKVSQWNKGKLGELKDRVRTTIE